MKEQKVAKLKLIKVYESLLNSADIIFNNEPEYVNFDQLFAEFVRQKYSSSEIMDMQMVWRSYTKALSECKKGELVKTAFYHKMGEEMLKSANLFQEQIQYLNVYIYPNLALYEHKKGKFDVANDYLLKAIKNIEIIEKEYPDAHASKIQQLHNVTRIDFRRGNYQQYIEDTKILINYLFFGIVDKENKFNLNPLILKKCSNNIIYIFIIQIFSEFIAKFLIGEIDLDMKKEIIEPLSKYNKNNYIRDWVNVCLDQKVSLENYGKVLTKNGGYLAFKLFTIYDDVSNLKETLDDSSQKVIIDLLNHYRTYDSSNLFSAVENKILHLLEKESIL